jgi:flagellar hook-associated protein 3 FlgL
MRITDGMMLNNALANQAQQSKQVSNLSTEASTGLKINLPSDDPAGYASVVSASAQISVLQSRSTAITAATGDLNLADGALSSASDLLVQAKQLATVAADGSQSASDRSAAATQVDEIVQQLIGLGNTQGASGYLFGGTSTTTPPFDATGAFTGNGTATQVEVATGVLATTNASGAMAFTAAGGRDVIADLQGLSTALSTNNVAAISGSLSTLDSDNSQIVSERANVGVATDLLQSSASVITAALTTDQTSRANLESADVPTTVSELSAAQTSYESAISVNRQLLTMFQTVQQTAPF